MNTWFRPLGARLMLLHSKIWIATATFLWLASTGFFAACEERKETLSKFLKAYCIDCHNQQDAQGEREFDSLRLPLDSESHLITADEIVDQLTLRQMPPPDSDQPTTEERIAIVEFLRADMRDARSRL